MSRKTILILGGGVGGLIAANALRRLLPEEQRVVLIEKSAQHFFAPSFLWLMVGKRQPDQITQEVRRLIKSGVEVIIAEAQALDLANRRVQTSAQTLHYDYLIIALGAEPAPETIAGLAETAHTFYTFDGSKKLYAALKTLGGGQVAIVVTPPYKCPGAPHEGAMLIADFFSQRGLRDQVEIHLFTAEPQPMPVAGPALGEAVKQMLSGQNVAFHPSHKLSSVNPATREINFEGKGSFKCDLLVTVPPHRGARLAREAGLANEAGWIPVDRATLKTKAEYVYAIGDANTIPLPGRWKPEAPLLLPKAGVFAHGQAEVVAHRIADEINGQGARSEFGGMGYCMLEAGESVAGFAYGNFFGEPSPQVELRQLGKTWHLGKVIFEQWWLAPYGLRRSALQLALNAGSKGLGIPAIY